MKRADKIVLAIGEHQMYSGEGRSRAKIILPENHIRLCKEAKKLGKPTIAVIYTGRPLELSEVSELCDSILLVWQPGTEGGNAIANLLYGKANPCGKLTMSFPHSTAQLPIYYNHLSTGRPKKEGDELPSHPSLMPFTSMYEDVKNEPLYPFGFGLSYSEFKLSNLKLSADKMARDDKITVSIEVENCGKYDGKEVIEFYLRDRFASVVRPVKELRGFKKIFLKAGEKQTVTFEINEEMLKFYNNKMQFVSENGDFDIMVSNGVCELKDEFKLI